MPYQGCDHGLDDKKRDGPETSATFSQLTWLIAREYVINVSRSVSFKYMLMTVNMMVLWWVVSPCMLVDRYNRFGGI